MWTIFFGISILLLSSFVGFTPRLWFLVFKHMLFFSSSLPSSTTPHPSPRSLPPLSWPFRLLSWPLLTHKTPQDVQTFLLLLFPYLLFFFFFFSSLCRFCPDLLTLFSYPLSYTTAYPLLFISSHTRSTSQKEKLPVVCYISPLIETPPTKMENC